MMGLVRGRSGGHGGRRKRRKDAAADLALIGGGATGGALRDFRDTPRAANLAQQLRPTVRLSRCCPKSLAEEGKRRSTFSIRSRGSLMSVRQRCRQAIEQATIDGAGIGRAPRLLGSVRRHHFRAPTPAGKLVAIQFVQKPPGA